MDMQQEHVTWTCRKDKQHRHAPRTCSMDMHGHGLTWMDMHGHAWTHMDVQHGMQQGHLWTRSMNSGDPRLGWICHRGAGLRGTMGGGGGSTFLS